EVDSDIGCSLRACRILTRSGLQCQTGDENFVTFAGLGRYQTSTQIETEFTLRWLASILVICVQEYDHESWRKLMARSARQCWCVGGNDHAHSRTTAEATERRYAYDGRHRLERFRCLFRRWRSFGPPDAKHRSDRQGRRDVHELVRSSELHRRARLVHDW